MTTSQNWLSKDVWAWSAYDFADTAFSALFITFFYPILIKNYLGGDELQIGLSLGLALLFGAFIVPFIGAIADATGKKLPILFVSTLITVVITSLTGFAGLGLALFLGFAANLFNLIDVDLYDSKLIDIAKFKNRGKVAGFGVAVGYLGTIASLIIGYILMSRIGWETKAAVQAIFPLTGAFHLIFSLPLFLVLKDAPKPKISFKKSLSTAFKEIKYTWTHMRDMPGLGSFLSASFIYNNAQHTVIIFLSLYATSVIGLSIQSFFFIFGFLSVASFIGSFIAGRVSDVIGPKKMLTYVLVIWIAAVLLLININFISGMFDTTIFNYIEIPVNSFFAQVFSIEDFLNPQVWAFIFLGMMGGATLGSVWTGNRHMVTRLAPKKKIAEIFGIEGLTEKFSGVIGPITFGLIVRFAGEGNELIGYQYGLFAILLFFVIGIIILQRVPKTAGV